MCEGGDRSVQANDVTPRCETCLHLVKSHARNTVDPHTICHTVLSTDHRREPLGTNGVVLGLHKSVNDRFFPAQECHSPMDSDSVFRYQEELAIIIGFALVLNPLVVGAYDIGDPDQYRYEPVEVEFYANGTYAYDSSSIVHPLDSDVACFDVPPSRSCVLERAIHANGDIAFDGPPRTFMTHDYDYVYIWESGFFRPATTEGENGTVRYGLESVPHEDALGDIATPLSRVSPDVRTAISQGKHVTSDELSGAHELVSTDEGYFVVTDAVSVNRTSERTGTVIALQWILGFTGAFLVLRGQRQRVEQG